MKYSVNHRVEITSEMVMHLKQQFDEREKNVLAQNVCTRFNLKDVIVSKCVLDKTSLEVTHKIDETKSNLRKLHQENQGLGPCRIVAVLNAMRMPFVKSMKIVDFEFSPTYLYFWDLLERSNIFLNTIIETSKNKEPIDGRLITHLMKNPLSVNENGGGMQWDMIKHLILKYGVMPKHSFTECCTIERMSQLNDMLNSKLREYAKLLRDSMAITSETTTTTTTITTDTHLKGMVQTQLAEIYKILAITMGAPNNTFVWEYYDKNGMHHSIGPITPMHFYEHYVKPVYNVMDKYYFVNDPRKEHQFGQMYTIATVNLLDTMPTTGTAIGIGRSTISYNNQPIEILMDLVVKSIKHGESVLFVSDTDKYFDMKNGIQDLKIHDYKTIFDVDVGRELNKAERLRYYESQMTHAMLINGLSLDKHEHPKKFLVENLLSRCCRPHSCCTDVDCSRHMNCTKGNVNDILMTPDWFKEYVYGIVVDKSLVPDDILKIFEMKPIVLPVWDPMGTLA